MAGMLVLYQVFRPLPQGGQYYLVIFLTGVLPLIFLIGRPGANKDNRPPLQKP